MASRMIREGGRYPSPGKQYELVVTIDSNGIVLYEICASGSSIPLVKGKAGSAYSKFYFMWDDKNNLWIDGDEANRVIFLKMASFVRTTKLSPITMIQISPNRRPNGTS